MADSRGGEGNALLLWADAPRFEYSTAPLVDKNDLPVAPATAGPGGSALQFNDQQVLHYS